MLGFRTNGAVRWLRWKVKLATGLCLAACYGLAVAQPANDNFSSAEALDVTLLHGSVTADTTQATIEAGEPNHAGLIVTNTVWYTWVAPQNGEVTFETYGSDYNNVLAVYRGAALGNLAQLGSSYGAAGFIQREAVYRGPVAAGVVRFNAQVGNTYRIAVGGRGAGGNMVLNWAYHSSGTFRFTTQMFECADTESEIIGNDTVAIREHNQPGVLVTVTRVGGSSGRVLVDYATEDGTALAPTPPDNNGDYWPAAGTLEFRDFELSKTILITVRPNTPAILTEDNMLSRYFIVRLSNPRLAAEESLEVSPPKLDPVMSASIVRIYDTSYDPELELNRDEETGELVGPLYRPVFNFSKRNYQIAEDVTNRWGSVVIWVDRSPGTNIGVTLHYEANSEPWWSGNQLDNTFRLQAASDYATPDPENAGYDGLGPDFGPITGTVTWGQDDWDPKPIRFDIYMDDIVEFNEDIIVNLWREDNGRRFTVGTVNQATITILHNDKTPPAGSLDQHHNADYAVDMEPPVITAPPSMAHPGADGVVFDLAVQEDDKTIIVGDFQSFNTVPINRIARMNYNGSLDTSFNPGDGANNFISTLELVPGGKIVIGGAFTFFNGTQRKSIARLNNDGSLDTSFDPGTGADGTIWAVAVQADGKVVVAGDFTSINGVPRLRVARLNEDGSVDASFDPGVNGPNGLVNALVLGSGGQVIIAGEFSALGALAHNNIARLNANGSIDNGFRFSIGLGFDGPIYALARQSDGRLLVGGEFSHFNVANRTRIARLNANGTLDTGFDPGTGANDTVYSIDPQSNGLIYVGGLFTSYNGTHRLGFTRLYADGTVDTSFLDTAYNQFAGLPRKYFNPGVSPKPFVWASGVQTDGNVMIGGGFDEVGGGQRERRGRVQWEDYSHNHREFLSRAGIRNRNNVARLVGGGTRGPGNIGLYYDNYSVNQDQGFLHVSLVRANGDLGYLAANFSVLPGSTQSGVDYLYNSLSPVYLGPWPSMVHMVSDGFFGVNTVLQDRFDTDYKFNVDCRVTLTILNPMIDGNRFSDLQLANPSVEDHFFLGGENIPIAGALGRSMADFT
ncbi:MAG TPA: Calx-beta domain-containing protein, partial [Clostridia bacterium]|nr:Calx-beta domain-containing protein [Clostridia bacterium]